MRLATVLATLVTAASLPLVAQQDPAAGDSAPPAPLRQGDAHAEHVAGGDPALAEWGKIKAHWKMVEAMPAESRTEHLEMHRGMLDELMGQLTGHAGQAPPAGASQAEVSGMREELVDLQAHWEMVRGIGDPEQLRTHLAMHMQMLESLYDEGEDAGVHRETAGEEMDHQEMGHDMIGHDEGMDHDRMHGDEEGEEDGAEGEYGPSRGAEPDKPAGY